MFKKLTVSFFLLFSYMYACEGGRDRCLDRSILVLWAKQLDYHNDTKWKFVEVVDSAIHMLNTRKWVSFDGTCSSWITLSFKNKTDISPMHYILLTTAFCEMSLESYSQGMPLPRDVFGRR